MNETILTKDKNKLTVTRTFNAPLSLVWRAWTEAELLDQWWAPKPWKSQTKRMDFRTGGHRLYAMVGPEGEEHWGWTAYQSVNPHGDFSGEDSFCDAEGNINPDLPTAYFTTEFEENEATTQVRMVTEYASEKHLQQVIEMGMEEGLKAAYVNLDALLSHELKTI